MIKLSHATFISFICMFVLTWYFSGIMDEYHTEKMRLQERVWTLEDAIKRFAGVHGVGLASFKEKDVVRHSLVKRLLKRYKPSFNIIDDVSAEKTISMWIHDEGLDAPEDGSIDNHYYKMKKN